MRTPRRCRCSAKAMAVCSVSPAASTSEFEGKDQPPGSTDMTTINPGTTSQVVSATTNNSSSSSSTGTEDNTIAGNFQTFLQLLTTQLKNQNPLDPLDTNQFTQQLVQFAQVEQQMNMNASLTSLISLQ